MQMQDHIIWVNYAPIIKEDFIFTWITKYHYNTQKYLKFKHLLGLAP